MKKHSHLLPFAALSVLGLANVGEAARNTNQDCAPEPGVCYSTSECECFTCLGPTNTGVNAPVRPKTCNGDFVITLAGFYWNANQDGMEYAVENNIKSPVLGTTNSTNTTNIQQLNNLIDSKYRHPDFKWDFGFKFGLGYNTTCDGWDIGVLWTWYRGKALDHVEAEPDDNRTLIPLWSAFASSFGSVTFATDIQTHWKMELNLVDIELGREYWTSKYLTLRPFVGLRVAYIKQDYNIQHRGGSWNESAATGALQPNAFNNWVDVDNDFKGVGVRGGLDTVWNFGCGWALYGNLAANIVYGRFTIGHDETNRKVDDDHAKTRILETHESFRASRAMLDLALGVQWNTMMCACQYGLTLSLGWEHHMFFDQNQMWRVVRIGDTPSNVTPSERNNTGENTFHQRRGDLSTQGWTLTVRFEF